MSTRRLRSLCLCAALLCTAPVSAFAAIGGGSGLNMGGSAKAVTPATKPPPLPPVEKPAEVQSTFPELPPSRPCVDADLKGLFHLVNVYEDPQGTETTSFRSSPNQYLMFRSSNLYGRINVDNANTTTPDVLKQLREHSTGLLQYLIQNNGFIYFYQNSVAVDVQACFVVAVNKVPFKTGQYLLMPPKGQFQGHLVKVYENLGNLGRGGSSRASEAPDSGGGRKAGRGKGKGKGKNKSR